jgi:DNA-binding transcriptional MerR regulator
MSPCLFYSGSVSATSYSLNDLAAATGLQPRTIRSYIAFGLITGPDSVGRGASYNDGHLRKLKIIRALKEVERWPLDRIRRELMTLSEAQGDELIDRCLSLFRRPEAPEMGSALDYLSTISEPVRPSGTPQRTTAPRTTHTPVDRLAERMERVAGRANVPRKAKGEFWYRVPITPDLELTVRGEPSPVEKARWERIADHIRQLLIGGSEDELDSRV